jgi:hypothetical protein
MRIELELPCMLTDEEVQSRGRMLGETVSIIDDTQTARTAKMKEFKEQLVGLNEAQRKLARVIRHRVENRMVCCAVLFHVPGEGMKRIVRTDTGEVVREEEMTESERQLNLFAAQHEFQAFMESQDIEQPPPADEPSDLPDDPTKEK